MNSNTTVTATFNLLTYTINASAGANGSISPQGAATVNYGASQSFTITPATGYGVGDVKVDGVSVGRVTSYLFGNVMANHTIAASFAATSPRPAPVTFPLGLKAGGTQYVDAGGTLYQADRYFTGGAATSTGAAIQRTGDQPLYQTQRYGIFSYAIPVANGNYDVTLRFVETTFSSTRQRVFDVIVEGKVVLNNLDIFRTAGQDTALDITFTVNVSDGVLSIGFLPKTGDAQVCAILINNSSSSPNNSPQRIKKYTSTEQRKNR
jgi:hypothetical protein